MDRPRDSAVDNQGFRTRDSDAVPAQRCRESAVRAVIFDFAREAAEKFVMVSRGKALASKVA